MTSPRKLLGGRATHSAEAKDDHVEGHSDEFRVSIDRQRCGSREAGDHAGEAQLTDSWLSIPEMKQSSSIRPFVAGCERDFRSM